MVTALPPPLTAATAVHSMCTPLHLFPRILSLLDHLQHVAPELHPSLVIQTQAARTHLFFSGACTVLTYGWVKERLELK